MSVQYEEIVETELSGVDKEIYLFQWLSSLLKYLKESDISDIKSNQAAIEKAAIRIINAPDPFPPPGRAIRNLVGKCLVMLYTRAETRTMFDTLQSFMRIAGDFKATVDKDRNKIAALSCVGDIMGVFGSQVMSFMAEIVTVTLKSAKSSNIPLLRYQALVTLQKSIRTAKRAITEATVKDVLKQMKSFLTDKLLPVQRASAEVIIEMYSSDEMYPSANDVESLLASCVRSLETADQVTRCNLARLAGHLLASTQVERRFSPPDLTQKPKKDQASLDDDDTISPAHTANDVKKALMLPGEMLLHLSNYFNKPHQTYKIRIGIFDFYMALFTQLGAVWVENNFALIVNHLLNEIIAIPRNNAARYETLLTRTLVGILLRDLIGVRLLSEQGQITAIQELANSVLKRWPAMMPGQVAPCSAVLVIVLREVAGLLQQLGNAPPPVQDALAEPLITILSHPSHTVRVTGSWTIRCFCYATPLRLPKTILVLLDKLHRDLSMLSAPASANEASYRALGHAYGLAALVSVIPERPLYVSYDVSAKVLDMATQLLKRASEHSIKMAAVEVEVAWTLIASLMSLGPNFVRPHLPQLLVLWRNALPKPTSKDSVENSTRSTSEWSFLLHIRESALGAVLCFLQHNSSTLVTLDVGRRIASVLGNALSFANAFINQKVEDPSETELPAAIKQGLTIREREALLRRRVYQCFTELGLSSIAESTQISLLQSTVAFFANPDGYPGHFVQPANNSSSSSPSGSIWHTADGYGWGVAYNDVADFGGIGLDSDVLPGKRDFLNRDAVEVSINSLLRKPVLGACEHDPLSLCQVVVGTTGHVLMEPAPPMTAVVDSAIELFARLLPPQDMNTVVKSIHQLRECIKPLKLEKIPGRRMAIFVNATVALLLALRHATGNYLRHCRETFGSQQVTNVLSPFLKDALLDGDEVLRSIASESLGRLAGLSGTNHLAGQVKDLIEIVVSDRHPNSRAGCALAFGAIYTHVGGLAAGPLLKTTVDILVTLSNDPHPTVHFWALHALSRVIAAASLAYSPFVSGTLGMLLKIYLMDSHEREGGALSNANISGDCPSYPVACQIIDAVITILGPDIQESARTRSLLLNLVQEFMTEEEEGIRVEAIKCIQHLLMFAADYIDIPETANMFRSHLASPRRPLKLASINALYQLVQKDALVMSRVGGDRLVEDLFGMLDEDSSVQGVRNVILSWLQQTVVYNPSAWVDLCQRIMSRTTASQQAVDAANRNNLRDDEGESLNLAGSQDSKDDGRSVTTSRWRTLLFALQCLHNICTIVAASGHREHFDAVFARAQGIPFGGLLFMRVSDLIKMAFSASTAYVTEIRLEGLIVLKDVIEVFATAPDPAYDDALLLEQYQAPVTAALTPAFSADSTPEILASAIHVCALFVGCGIVKDVARMGRVLRLLTTALEQLEESGMLSIGETGDLSPNASAMLRISILSAWAQLQVSSLTQNYLDSVIIPYRSILPLLWIVCLRDYASIKIDTEFLQDTSSVAIDSSYSSLGREVLLPYYTKSWPIILHAVATSLKQCDPAALAAMDGQEMKQNGYAKLEPREEPTTYFYVIFGLICEALCTPSADLSNGYIHRQAVIIACLEALKSLVKPQFAGRTLMESTILNEFINLSYRIAMTEPPTIQLHLVEMLGILATSQGSRDLDVLSFTSPQSHCLRICSYILKQCTGYTRNCNTSGQVSDQITLINATFNTLILIAASIDSIQQEDVRSTAAILYNEIMKDETSEIDVVSNTFPSLKLILSMPILPDPEAQERYQRLVHALLSSCLLNIDEMRGRSGMLSTKKIKSNLLSAVLILTVIPSTIRVGRAVLEHACFLIRRKLLESDEQISLTAAQCAKTLIVAGSSGNPVLCYCTKLLMSGMIEFIAKVTPSIHSGSVSETQVNATNEILRAFSSFFSAVAEDHRPRLLGALLPILAMILSKDSEVSTSVNSLTITQILTYATASPAAFKAATGQLEPNIREDLESSVRKVVGLAKNPSQANTKPQISLRSF